MVCNFVGHIQSFKRIKSQVNDVRVEGDVFSSFLSNLLNEVNHSIDDDRRQTTISERNWMNLLQRQIVALGL